MNFRFEIQANLEHEEAVKAIWEEAGVSKDILVNVRDMEDGDNGPTKRYTFLFTIKGKKKAQTAYRKFKNLERVEVWSDRLDHIIPVV